MQKAAIGVGVILVILGGLWGLSLLPGSGSVTNSPGADVFLPRSTDWVLGNASSSIVLLEYSDFQCPACGVYYPAVDALLDEFGAEIQFIYRHFPLAQHKNAKLAAVAAEASGRQGQFWEMHGLLFSRQHEWSESGDARNVFLGYAKELGLGVPQFASDLDSADLARLVEQSFEEGVSLGVTATPTFFLNGEKINNPRTYDEFRTLIGNVVNKVQ